MARPPKGKPLTLRPIRLDDDVWAECQRLGKEHGTINEGLRTVLWVEQQVRKKIEKHFEPEPLEESPNVVKAIRERLQEVQGRVMAETGDPWKALSVREIAATKAEG